MLTCINPPHKVTPIHDDGHGHEVIFLHAAWAAGHLTSECTQLLTHLADTMRSHDPRPGRLADGLSLRCAELHTYGVGGGLMERDHKDSGSSLTMSLLLSDTAAFEGGRFLTYDAGGAPVEHDVQCGDGILFRSEDLHNVTPLERGVRHALVLELWVGTTNCVDRER